MDAAKVDTSQNRRRSSSLVVLTVVLESGEHLPCLVDRVTWIPVRVAMRWAVRYRRYRVQSSKVESNLRTIGRIYEWAESVAGLDLDDYLTSRNHLSSRQIESIALYFRTKGDSTEASVEADPGILDHHLSVAENFLKWALDSDNRGGVCRLSLEELCTERSHIEQVFRSLRIGARPSQRIQPLTESEIEALRRVLVPKEESADRWMFPKGVFRRL